MEKKMILDALRDKTNDLHERFDAQYETVLFFDLTPETYKAFVHKLYGYYVPAEQRLEHIEGWQSLGVALGDRKKVPSIIKDLHALGETDETISRIPLCTQLPTLDTIAQALGYLYVIEGGTFGDELVAKQLREANQINGENGAAFFKGPGPEQVKTRWGTFMSVLMSYAQSHPDANDAIVNAASETFETYEYWLFEGKVTNIKRIDPSFHEMS